MKKSIKGQITKSSEGITLIALVVTIIVLIILAGVSINALVGQNGIVTKAQEARDKYANSAVYENEQLANVEAYSINLGSAIRGSSLGSGAEPEELISTQVSFVGCYADIDGNGTIDGIIYADLLAGKPDDGEWGIEWYDHDYSLPTDVTTSNVKQYVKSETARTDSRFDNTPRYVISPARNTSGTKDRFYVMGLNDITNGTNNKYYWYSSAWIGEEQGTMSDYATYTSEDFGTGKANTAAMLTKWNAAGYGTKNDKDLWKWIDVGVNGANKGWFVPSAAEWAAFASAFSITMDNYTNYHMSKNYWTSSQEQQYSAWNMFFDMDYITGWPTDGERYIRLSTTF